MTDKLIRDDESFEHDGVRLRLCRESDVGAHYVRWLNDPEVNRFLETRFTPQTESEILGFVRAMRADVASYLFAIVDIADASHVGNIKLGPINAHHRYADVSYFVGERDRWGRGIARRAIHIATEVAFNRLELHRVRAGVYEENRGSARALEAVGYRLEGTMRKQFLVDDKWQDHLSFSILEDEWRLKKRSK